MCSVRAIWDTPVAGYSVPGINTMHQVTYHPPITALLFLLALWVSCYDQTHWHSGQLWQPVGMCSFGMCLHRNCNEMGKAANNSPCIPSTCLHSAILSLLILHIIPSNQMCVGIDNPLLVLFVSCLTMSSKLCKHFDVQPTIFRHWKLEKQYLSVRFSPVQILRWDPSY
jgi:hypothetical protein